MDRGKNEKQKMDTGLKLRVHALLQFSHNVTSLHQNFMIFTSSFQGVKFHFKRIGTYDKFMRPNHVIHGLFTGQGRVKYKKIRFYL